MTDHAHKGIAAEIEKAEAALAALKLKAMQATCAEMGAHDWQFVGGANAHCGLDGCGCSRPVYQCTRCGDCDYGDNAEGDEIVRQCRELGTGDYCHD